jgi:CBS domain-containing protein
MKAGDVMTTGAATVKPTASLAEAAHLMIEHRISGLPVVDDGGQLVGIISEGDFLRRQGGERRRWIDVLLDDAKTQDVARELSERRVEDAMSKSPISVGVEAPLPELLDAMESHNVKRLPVVDNGRVVGIVSRANLLLALMRKAGRTSDVKG